MKHNINSKKSILILFFLVSATLVTTWLYNQNNIDTVWATNIIFFLVYLKGRAIVLSFMAIGNAPTAWRIAYELWLLIATAIIALIWNYTNQTKVF